MFPKRPLEIIEHKIRRVKIWIPLNNNLDLKNTNTLKKQFIELLLKL